MIESNRGLCLRKRLQRQYALLAWLVWLFATSSHATDFVLFHEAHIYHLRIDGPREWSEFPEKADSSSLELHFQAKQNDSEQTLKLRQIDVKQQWNILINDKSLGRLRVDENDMHVYFPVPIGTIVDGENTLRIEQSIRGEAVPDDVRIGDITVDSRPIEQVLNECSVEINVTDSSSGQSLPARITIVDKNNSLQSTGATSNSHLAVRPGTVFTSTGVARFGLPAGQYTIYAGRGFEYSLDSTEILLRGGDSIKKKLSIQREVPTAGYVACDPHVHTLTHSGHGDASVNERMITLAAEGIELPIATDHNVNIDHHPFAEKLGVRRFFTPVIGNEVTTRVGHFNIFPIEAGAKPPNHDLADWKLIFREIYRTPGVKAVILNHGRDIHGGTRPLGPKLHNAAVGENLKRWPPGMNAMEVVNSAATQTDVMQLFHDWMTLLNRGRSITPVGSSDSHDVARHFVGQGRTYIRCEDRNPSNIDIQEAVDNFVAGQVLVSYGLIADLTVNGKYKSGELVRGIGNQLDIHVEVLGPHWVSADKIRLFANGHLVREETIGTEARNDLPAGVKWAGKWTIDTPPHDVHLVAIASGPGIDLPYWKTAKPYQATSPHWQPQTIGCSGAVWLDVDGDGRKTAARDYAESSFAKSNGNVDTLVDILADYDRAVAAQAAHLFQASGQSWLSADAQEKLRDAPAEVQAGIRMYIDAWRASQIAQVEE